MDEASMLEAMAAEPRNLQLRLIYADWFEEQGDPRAEYIRLEEPARKVQPWMDEAWNSRLRRRELQASCSPEWLRKLGYPPAGYQPLFSLLPTARENRWRLMHLFVETWHERMLTPDTGAMAVRIATAEERLGFPLPAAIREFYLESASRLGVWSENGPEELQPMESGRLLRFFETRNAGSRARYYAVVDERDDPEVYCEYRDRQGHASYPSCQTFSEFALFTHVAGAIQRAACHATVRLPRRDAWRELEILKSTELNCAYGASGRLAIQEGADLLVAYSPRRHSVLVGARNAPACDCLPPRLRGVIRGVPRTIDDEPEA